MFQRNLSFLSIALLSASLSFGASVKGHEGHDRRDLGKFVAHLEKELDLTPTQSAQVREALNPDSLRIFAPHLGMDGGLLLAGEFLNQLRLPSVDTASLNRVFTQLAVQQRELYVRAQVRFTMLHSALTLEQRHKLADLLQKRLDRVEERHEKKDAKKK